MNEQKERKQVERSPNFPFITLEQALNRARQFYEQEKRGAAPFPVAAKHWNYSPSSSGALQTAAALKSYGLMVDEGGGANRKMKLTDLALRIILDTRPDSTEREMYKRQAALSPAVAAEVYSNSNGILPSEATLNHFLVLERGFNQSTAVRSVKIMQQNEEFTKSASNDLGSSSNESSISDTAGDNSMTEVSLQYVPGNPAPILVRRQKAAPQVAMSGHVERIKDAKNQDITLQFVEAPTIEAYEFLKDYIDLRVKALRGAENTAAAKDKDKQT